jgi:hypothetical protein
VYIDFAAFMGALKADKDKSIPRDASFVESEHRASMDETVTDRTMDKEKSSRFVKNRQSIGEEQMLDVAEGCFIKMADLLLAKQTTVRSVFSKYAIPEIFPDRSVLELLSAVAFFEGLKELGLVDLQEMEAACLMRVLAKPELDNAVILNELVLIMENFGVPDVEDAEDDYVPDTEPEQSKDEEPKEPKII